MLNLGGLFFTLTTTGDQEYWLPVEGFEGYEVSSLGNIKKDGRLLTPHVGKGGYLRLTLYKYPNQLKAFSVHRLVCSTFNSSTYFPGAYALHKNNVRSDNRACNLYWGTQVQNMQDKVDAGNTIRGEQHHSAKLTCIKVQEIRRKRRNGVTLREIAEDYGISIPACDNIVKDKTWKECLDA